jgi:hypothetical protein
MSPPNVCDPLIKQAHASAVLPPHLHPDWSRYLQNCLKFLVAHGEPYLLEMNYTFGPQAFTGVPEGCLLLTVTYPS